MFRASSCAYLVMPGVSAWPGRSFVIGSKGTSDGSMDISSTHGTPSGPVPVEKSRFSMNIAIGPPSVSPCRTPADMRALSVSIC